MYIARTEPLYFIQVFFVLLVCVRVKSHVPEQRSFSFLFSRLWSLTSGLLKFLNEGEQYQGAEASDITPVTNEKYDFIVVGAGTAGSVVASRLSEIPDVTVLLLEAGRSENLAMDIPLLVHHLQFNNDINWKYRTEPSDKYCLGMDDRRCNWPRGRVMGGSSVLNYMAATRGDPRDYDRWKDLGNTGWSYEDVLHYFKKLEDIGIPDLMADEDQHSTSGPLPINHAPFRTPGATAFLEAGIELGFKVRDHNSRNVTGFSYLQTNTENGMRVSSNRAYLHPAKKRRNLFVSKNSLVSKVIIDQRKNRAVGVQFIKGNRKFSVRSRKEVILCGGTIGSAQILMLSGIGPGNHLTEMGIPLIKDAPVGKNLLDHLSYGGFVVPVSKPATILFSDVSNPGNPYLDEYFNTRQGPLTIPGGLEAVAFLNVDTPQDHNSWPNIEMLFLGASVAALPRLYKTTGVSDRTWDQTFKPIEGKHTWNFIPMLLRPLSRGEMLLRNRNIQTPPRLIPNYLSHPNDVRVMVAGIRAAQNITRTRAMKRFGAKLFDVQMPGCEDYPYDSDDDWECALRTIAASIYHHVGTAKMGPEGDPTAVVNPRLQVYGVEGLRVADASIMPEIPAAHTNVPVIMIGEKLSDMVKEDWGYSTDNFRTQT